VKVTTKTPVPSSPLNDSDKKAGEDSETQQKTRQEQGEQDQTQEEDGEDDGPNPPESLPNAKCPAPMDVLKCLAYALC
jgi:hypothetical protein